MSPSEATCRRASFRENDRTFQRTGRMGAGAAPVTRLNSAQRHGCRPARRAAKCQADLGAQHPGPSATAIEARADPASGQVRLISLCRDPVTSRKVGGVQLTAGNELIGTIQGALRSLFGNVQPLAMPKMIMAWIKQRSLPDFGIGHSQGSKMSAKSSTRRW